MIALKTDNRTVDRKQTQMRLNCSDEEREQIIEVAAERRMEYIEPSFVEILNHAIEVVLPPERQRTRKVKSMNMVPLSLYRAVEERFIEKVTCPVQVLEVDRPLPESTPELSSFSYTELKEEITRREIAMAQELIELRNHVVEVGQSHVSVAVYNTPLKPQPPVVPVKIWKIGIVGFSGGQIDALRRRTVHHKNYVLDIRELGKRKNHLFSGSVDVVLSWRTRIDHGHMDRLLGKLEGVIPIGWVSNMDEAVNKLTNVCIGRPVDHQG